MDMVVCEAHLGQSRELVQHWNSIHPHYFHVRKEDIIWNLTEQNLVKYELHWFNGTPVLAGVAAPIGIGLGIDPKSLWISLWGKIDPTDIQKFIDRAIQLAQEHGKTRIAFGSDEFHFVPGVPTTDQILIAALQQNGFQGHEYVDFNGSLLTQPVQSYITEAQRLADERGITLVGSKSAHDIDVFLSREFPGRWLREFRFWNSRADTGRGQWLELRNVAELIGFARICKRDRIRPSTEGWTPGSLRLPCSTDSGSKWIDSDGCLGPIGLAASQRGQGTGRILLGLVLKELISNHAERICIDWTNALNYYSPLKFEVSRRYWSAAKTL